MHGVVREEVLMQVLLLSLMNACHVQLNLLIGFIEEALGRANRERTKSACQRPVCSTIAVSSYEPHGIILLHFNEPRST